MAKDHELKAEEKGLLVWAQRHNSGQILRFHNEIFRLMRNEVVWIDRKLDLENLSEAESQELRARKSEYSQEFLFQLRANAFLMMYGHLEEWLYHICRRFQVKVSSRSGGLKRFAEGLKLVLDEEISSITEWSFLLDCSEVRNCLLHANGRISLFKKESRIRQISASRSSGLEIVRDRIRVKGRFLEKVDRNIQTLIQRCHAKIGGD